MKQIFHIILNISALKKSVDEKLQKNEYVFPNFLQLSPLEKVTFSSFFLKTVKLCRPRHDEQKFFCG